MSKKKIGARSVVGLSLAVAGLALAVLLGVSSFGAVTQEIGFNMSWPYASYSMIHTGKAVLYRADKGRGICIAVNAGHGTAGGEAVKTFCHPDMTAKVTGGSTAAGVTTATAISNGTTLIDGTPEREVVLKIARLVRDGLLQKGFDVLMLRDGEDVQLDNIARTVLANQNSQAHVSIHLDGTQSDKGFFYVGVPEEGGYRLMEPVASHYQEHIALGESILQAFRNHGRAIFSGGSLDLDLTQTSYSTIPSVDLEVGDTASDLSEPQLSDIAGAIVDGLCLYFSVSEE